MTITASVLITVRADRPDDTGPDAFVDEIRDAIRATFDVHESDPVGAELAYWAIEPNEADEE